MHRKKNPIQNAEKADSQLSFFHEKNVLTENPIPANSKNRVIQTTQMRIIQCIAYDKAAKSVSMISFRQDESRGIGQESPEALTAKDAEDTTRLSRNHNK